MRLHQFGFRVAICDQATSGRRANNPEDVGYDDAPFWYYHLWIDVGRQYDAVIE
jgi:hypothetical protein